MLHLLYALLATARSSLKSQRQLALENLALRQQLAILRRKTKRPKPNKADRATSTPPRSFQKSTPIMKMGIYVRVPRRHVMKKCISASSALLATAMMVTLSVGCGEGIEGETGSQSAELTAGQCNAIVARVLGTAQHCNQFGCSADECGELLDAFLEFFIIPPAECAVAAGMGELNGLPCNAFTQPGGDPKHIQEVICGAAEACGLCEAGQAQGICLTTDACNP